MLRQFATHYRPYKGLFFLDFGCAVVVGLLELGFPLAVNQFVDKLLPGKDWTLIVLAFVGLAIFLACEHRLTDSVAMPVFISVGSYFLGIGFGTVVTWWTRGRAASSQVSWFDDVKALVTLAAVGLAISVQMFGWQQQVPFGEKLEALPLALMLFYFGSR